MPLITIFSSPKPFINPHIATIQRNAIQSWTLLPDYAGTPERPRLAIYRSQASLAPGVKVVTHVATDNFGGGLYIDVPKGWKADPEHPAVAAWLAERYLAASKGRAWKSVLRC